MSAWVSDGALLAAAFLQGHQGHSAAAPPAFYEYLLVVVAVVAMVWTLYLAVRMTVRPGEDRPDHIKRRILEEAEDLAQRQEDEVQPRNQHNART